MNAITVSFGSDGHRVMQVEKDFPKPSPGPGELLLKVILAGICGTDLEILEGYKSIEDKLILGHEFVGRLCEFGPESEWINTRQLSLGDRVVAEINCVPFGCKSSRNSSERAQDRTRTAMGIFGRNGAFSEYVTVPIENVHRVPDDVLDEDAVFAEPLAAACQILEQIHLPPSNKIGVLGAGKLGWIVAQVLLAFGKDVTVVARESCPRSLSGAGQPSNDDLARHYGAKLVAIQPPGKLAGLEDHFDNVVDCTGNSRGLETAINIVKPRGTVILKSTTAVSETFGGIDLTPVVVKEIRIVGSRCGPFPVALRLLKRKSVTPSRLVRVVMSPHRAQEAFKRAGEKGSLKILIRFEE